MTKIASNPAKSSSPTAIKIPQTKAEMDAFNSRNAGYYQDSKGNIVKAPTNSPISSNQQYTQLGTIKKPGGAPSTMTTINGKPGMMDVRGNKTPQSIQTLMNTGAMIRGGLGGSQAGSTGVSGGRKPSPVMEGGITSNNVGAFQNTSGYNGTRTAGFEGGHSAASGWGQPFNLGGFPMTPGLGTGAQTDTSQQSGALGASTLGGGNMPATDLRDKSKTGQLTGEDVAYQQYLGSVGGAQTDLANASADYQDKTGFLQGNYQQQASLIQGQEGAALNQATRLLEESLASQQVDKMKAEQEYQQAQQQISQNRSRENDYLMQKLASAGAIDSTGGVTILSRSSEKYDQILGNLAGQRQIALSEFSLADSKIRNQYGSTIENVVLQATQLQQQLASEFQQHMLSAMSEYRGAKGDANKAQQEAYTNYLGTLYSLQEARKEAEMAAAQAAAEAQQQAFDNAIARAGLTGTFIDPVTGEEIRTLNGLKYDDAKMAALAGGGSGGSGSGKGNIKAEDLSAYIQKGLQYGIISQDQVNTIMNSVSGSKGNDIGAQALVWATALADQIGQYENASIASPSADGWKPKQGFGLGNVIPGAQQDVSYNLDASGNLIGSTVKGSSYNGSSVTVPQPAKPGLGGRIIGAATGLLGFPSK